MSILTGFKKVKNYILTSSGYQLLSRWTSSQTVEFDDGKTAQEKLGEINGIAKTYVDMKKVTDNSMAASAKAVMEGLENSSALISMTQAEYDALSEEEKTDNNMRAIIDANPDVVDAKNVNFDNTDTNLAATNTQSAITELNGKLSVRYNTDTDTVQILYNGTWVDWKSGEQTDIPLFISGQGSVNTDISGGFTKTSGNYTGNVNLNAIVMSATNATNTSGLYSVVIGSGKLIDRTVYKKVKFHATVSGSGSNNAYANLNTDKTNYGDRLAPKDGYQRIVTGDNVLDISDAASNGYLCFFLGVNSGTVSVTIDSIVLCK